MDNVHILSPENMGRNFIPAEYLPAGKDEYYLRNSQIREPESGWRHLRSDEVEVLVKNDNSAGDWDDILVSDPFDPRQIKNSRFFGLVRMGRMRDTLLQHHDLRMPAGITNSLIISCDIGDDVAIHDVHYLAHYIIGSQCILMNIDEMHTTDHAKFGNGVVKEGEPESVRTWLDVMNETGCRGVLPFDGMITADAYLWGKYRDDQKLLARLKEITQNSMDPRRGYYGSIGNHCVVKHTLILKDVRIGSHCYIKGANKLKNLTINSSAQEPSQIGEGVVLVNGVVGYGCRIFYNCTAVRFILGDNSNLKYGARLINSFMGDNSTISCCEVLNNLIFPAHEQHHNNSFLVASVLMGQSNMAAGATIGSNHNSRANDNEIQAGRGFWPGLCASVKHSCRFASFVLLSKADYPSELDIPMPFSLLNNNVSCDRLEVMPAFWWMYNMYALIRNSRKYHQRDKRMRKVQHVEFEPFAPDTMEEVIRARALLEQWIAKADLLKRGVDAASREPSELAMLGRELIKEHPDRVNELEVLGENMEHGKRKVLIVKHLQAWTAYGDMLCHYAVCNLMDYLDASPDKDVANMAQSLAGARLTEWVNLGGQIMPAGDVDQLRRDVRNGTLSSWEEIHARYDALWERYPLDKQKHAYSVLCALLDTEALSEAQWHEALRHALSIQHYIAEQVYVTRKKDYDNPFHQSTFRNEQEMEAAVGKVEENSFVIEIQKDTLAVEARILRLLGE